MPTETKTPETVLAPEPDAGPPSDTFRAIVQKVEQGMKEWEQSRFKQETKTDEKTKEPEQKTETAKEKGEPTAPAVPAKDAGHAAPDADRSGGTVPENTGAAEPVPKETAPETPEEPEDKIPAVIKSPKAADEFRNLRRTMAEKIKAKETELLGLKKELERQKKEAAKPVASAEVESLRKEYEQLKSEREQLIDMIERANLEASPRFQGKYQRAFSELEAAAKSAAGDAHAEKVIGLLALPPSKYRKDALNQIMSELDPVDQQTIGYAFAQMDRVRSDRDAELSNHRDIIRQEQAVLQAQQAQQEEIARAKKEYLIGEILKAAGKFEAFMPIEGDDAHNAEAEVYKKEIAEYINGEVDETYSAFLPVLAAEGQYLKTKKVPALEAKIKELETTIGELTGSQPKPGEGRRGAKEEEPKTKGFAEAFLKNWSGPAMGG